MNNLANSMLQVRDCFVNFDKFVVENKLDLNLRIPLLKKFIEADEYFLENGRFDEERMKEMALMLIGDHKKYRFVEPSHEIPKTIPYFGEYGKKDGCYIATCVYGSYDCPSVWTLRRFRDTTLTARWYGRFFIRLYYAISPTLVKWFGTSHWFKTVWKIRLDKLVKKLQAKGVESTPYQDRNWR